MRYILGFCISTLLLVGLVMRLSGMLDAKPAAMVTQSTQRTAATKAAPAPSKRGSGVAYVRLDRQNQFTTPIEIEGKPFHAIIDTGATIVIVRYEDAKQLGVFSKGERWNRVVSTANGAGRAMSARFNNLSIGDLIVYDVEALVLSPGAVSTNLIGMSLLRRLSKFEVRPDVIVLER
jgi:aspartyl protease family protein